MDLSDLGARTGGTWTTSAATAAGLTREQVRRRVERGEWQRLRRGVLADAGIAPDAPMRAWAALLAAGGPERARATGRTSARLLDLPLLDDDGAVDDVAVRPGTRGRSSRSLRVHELALVRGDHVRVRGCPSVSLARSLPLLAAALPYEGLVCLLDAALRRQLLDDAQLAAVLDRHAGQPHVRALRRAVQQADARAESPAESLARLVLLPVLPDLVPQVVLRGRWGQALARFDLADPALRLAVEVDGLRAHAGAQMAAKDHQRDRVSAALGWTTERCTWAELRRDPDGLRRRIDATAARLRQRAA